ncbi:hypothetical protein KBC04_04675 [Candidatus Babeliales bacterium]|nr:hypothetical protein [Candidatus Babeliales bacterium]MBP9844114.1 hypothetical protein [Candidatus Babeliales bacterium]
MFQLKLAGILIFGFFLNNIVHANNEEIIRLQEIKAELDQGNLKTIADFNRIEARIAWINKPKAVVECVAYCVDFCWFTPLLVSEYISQKGTDDLKRQVTTLIALKKLEEREKINAQEVMERK